MPPTATRLGDAFMLRLTFERLKQGKTQLEIARLTRIPQPHLSLMELNRLAPTEQDLDRLSRVLGIPVDEVMEPVEIFARPRKEAQQAGA